jgi:hypothetical protein
MDEAHSALLAEIRRRLETARDDPSVTNCDGSNYWGPHVTRAVDTREHDGQALVQYIKDVLRKSGESEGWNALLEARRLDISFEDMVLTAKEPMRDFFSDEDRAIAAWALGEQQREIERRLEAAEAAEVERDRRIVAQVAASRHAAGKPSSPASRRKCLPSARSADAAHPADQHDPGLRREGSRDLLGHLRLDDSGARGAGAARG